MPFTSGKAVFKSGLFICYEGDCDGPRFTHYIIGPELGGKVGVIDQFCSQYPAIEALRILSGEKVERIIEATTKEEQS